METEVTLSQAILQLRKQLQEAADEGRNSALRFAPKAVEIELAVTFKIEAEAGGV
jgi:hypothetical protein